MNDSFLYDPLGPLGRRKARLAMVVTSVAVLLLLALIVQRLASRGQLEPERWAILADPSTGVPQTLGIALVATLKAALLGMLIALVVGLLLAVGRLSQHRVIRWGSGVFVEGFRGLPLLLLMLFASLGLPSLGIELSLFTIVVASLVAYNSSVLCEIIRGGVLALDRGQSEAAEALGVSRSTTLRRVLLPQAIPQMLPVIISQMVILLKDTSLGFIIGYSELLRSGRSIVEYYGNLYALQVYVAVAALYIATNVVISLLAQTVARRQWTRSGGGVNNKPGTALPLQPTQSVL